ncbi:LOW QUALITY PROTEIN: U3 small nucleolar RNA-associated protein 15 homolog [Aphomia sociella]
MAHVSYPFKKTNKAVFQKPASVLTQDAIYWRKLGQPVLVKEFGAIDYLDFSPVEPHYFAATCSVRVQIYDPITKVVAKNISKFVQAAYGGCFKNDGRLLVAGSEEAAVKLFDVQSKNVLRVFTGHTGPVHRTFFTKDQVKIVSFSDDKSVCLWDVATEEKILSFTEHSDYVRAGATSPISPDLILSGGYDNIVKLYDCRSNETALTVNHGSPVESTLFLPSGGIFISAGGTEIKVWDIFNGGKLLANISQHHKTVTTLKLASNNSRLMSASLDRHVKIYDISTFKVVHNIDYPNAVLSLAISEKDDTLAVGMTDGVISKKREKPAKQKGAKKGLYKFAPEYIESQNFNTDNPINKDTKSETDFDKYLRKMEYTKALASILSSVIISKYPEKTAAGLQQLLRWKVLNIAISGLSDKHLGFLLKYLRKNLGETRFARTIIDAANVFIDVYENQLQTLSETNLLLYTTLQQGINNEIDVCKKVGELEGAICMLLSAGQFIDNRDNIDVNNVLAPSSNALKDIVIDVGKASVTPLALLGLRWSRPCKRLDGSLQLRKTTQTRLSPKQSTKSYYYTYHCPRHFEQKFRLPSKRLTPNAIPTLNIYPLVPSIEIDENIQPSISAPLQLEPAQIANLSSQASAAVMPILQNVEVEEDVQPSTSGLPQIEPLVPASLSSQRSVVPVSKTRCSVGQRKRNTGIKILEEKIDKLRQKCKTQLKKIRIAKKLAMSKSFLQTIEKFPDAIKTFVKLQLKGSQLPRGRRYTTGEKIMALTILKQMYLKCNHNLNFIYTCKSQVYAGK